MTEKPRDYKKRVDAEWRKNEKSKNKLIKKIKEYELLDEGYKEKVEREILEAFSKKEKEEKGKDYENVVRLIKDSDKKYDTLGRWRGLLKVKEEERAQKENEIRENKLNRTDKTAMDRQMIWRREKVKERGDLEQEIEEIKKNISDMEEEIKDMEEEYGEKLDTSEEIEDESIDDNELPFKKAKIEEPTTLKEYHKQTIQDLWNKDRIRGEIIKILKEGTWLGEELSKKIERDVTDSFIKYYDEKQGSLKMKAGRRGKNKLNKREKRENVAEEQRKEEIENIGDTPRKIRERLIMEWYEKKLNRDELLRVLEENEIMDKGSKKKMKEEIIKDFYDNYEKAKEEEGYQMIDTEYREIKRTKRQLKGKTEELTKKMEDTKGDMEEIDKEMEEIAQKVMKLENGSWWNKRKLEKVRARWEELDKQERNIKKEIWKLEVEKMELQILMKDKESKYGSKIERELDRPERVKRKITKEQEEKELTDNTTLKGYKERYEQMIKNKEEYNEKLLGAVRDLDVGISEEKKKEVLEKMEVDMKKEIEEMKRGDETMRMAEETEKWLRENWKSTMEKLIGMKKEIEEKEIQVDELESKENGENADKIIQIKREEYELKDNIFELKEEYDQIKADFNEKLKRYDGTYIPAEEKLVVETWEEKEERKRKEKIEKTKEILGSYRQRWKESININSEIKEKIIGVADRIPVVITEEVDGSKMIEMKIGGKTYKILDVNLKSHSDGEVHEYRYNDKYLIGVDLPGIEGENIDERRNKKLANYIKQQKERGFGIPTEEIQNEILEELDKYLDCDFVTEDQIALRMYITGLHGCYLLKGHEYVRFGFARHIFSKYSDVRDSYTSIYLISCE